MSGGKPERERVRDIARNCVGRHPAPGILGLVAAGASNMLSNDFWYGFLIGAFLVFGVFLTYRARIRAKNEAKRGNTGA